MKSALWAFRFTAEPQMNHCLLWLNMLMYKAVDRSIIRFNPIAKIDNSSKNEASSFIGAQCRVLGGFGSHFHLLFQCRYLTVTTGAPDGRAAPRGM